ncbi:prephenate dehydrogenase [Streptomyces sp. SL13]|uniref:Prephenate dehydrogenase n=1 Tax=Streptantibioticus silvisoli TaxID=2705255 RepID=A0AA90H0Z4_9ACTN|nr:prephenate dehydrogenase [Streptantibioticus silvisoli]MDI5968899.1 prephenate dehydrogenase [Streptantibioticus silvisoli]
MATTTGAHNDIASTIKALEAELPQLEDHQGELEKNLAAVTERLAAVRVALTSLKALDGAPAPLSRPAAQQQEEAPETVPAAQPQAAPAEARTPKPKAEAVPAPRRTGESKSRQGTKTPKPAVGRKKTRATATTAVESGDDQAAQKPAGAGRTAKKAPAEAAPAKRTRTPGLSLSIVAVLTKAGKPLRAGEVNEILGRDKSNGNVNSVRTALERLVVNQDIQRVGRGLYEANQA